MTDVSLPEIDIPSIWKTPLTEIPEKFRDAIVSYALKLRDSILSQEFTDRLPMERTISAETTGLSAILAAAYFPYHLIPEHELMLMLMVIKEQGTNGALKILRNKGATVDVVMVLGDLPVENHMFKHLDAMLSVSPARYLVAGPGTEIESVLRVYMPPRQYAKSFLRTADQSGGKVWDSAPGPALDALVERLFKEHQPTRVIAFEPVRLPSTQIAMDFARQLNLPVECIEAPAIKKNTPAT